jgi:hypothetical protein
MCPLCGGFNLHHMDVIVYNRPEDDDVTKVTEVRPLETRSLLADSKSCGNPSSRRDGLRVTMWCETCESAPDADPDADLRHFSLLIYQHKGTTYVEWDVGTVPVPAPTTDRVRRG